MTTNPQVMSDLTALRRELQTAGMDSRALCSRSVVRPLLDIGMDWAVIALVVVLVQESGAIWMPLALLVIGNRQRALGNLLHDAGHGNLAGRSPVNDVIARILLAGALLADLAQYRAQHMRHHQSLGLAGIDPDLIDLPGTWPRHWLHRVKTCIFERRSWWGSVAGHLGVPGVPLHVKAGILGWWATFLAGLTVTVGAEFALSFAGLWMLSRATVFHVITTVREMVDHHGLTPGGVFSFTRDLVGTGALRTFIHPRHNGYHLTHHLLPAVPYHRLPFAQRALTQLPSYQRLATVCDGYVAGHKPVVASWAQPA